MTLSKGLIKGASLRASTVMRPSVASRPAPGATPVPREASPAGPPVQQAAAVVAPPRPGPDPAELARLKEAARQEGLALGLQQAQAEAERVLRDKLGELSRLMSAVSQAYHAHCRQQEAHLADFAFVAVNRVLGDVLQDRAAVLPSVRAALQASQPWQEATLELHPQDLEMVSLALGQEAALQGLRCVASPAVALGGCRVVTPEGTLDARLEVQLAALHAQLQAARDTPAPKDA